MLGHPTYQRDLPGHVIEDAVEEVLEHPDYQRELPRGEPRRRASPPATSSGVLDVILQALLWIVLGVVALLLVAWIAQGIRSRRRRDESGEKAAGGTSDATDETETSVPDHERLAREGRFAEAIHALLLLAIGLLGRRNAVALEPARTSREVLRGSELVDEGRSALAGLVQAVELSRFGGREAGRSEYGRCLDGYRTLEGRLGDETS